MHKDSKEIIDNLYQQEYNIVFQDQSSNKIPEEGSLGILALGYKGIIAWRKTRGKVYKKLKADIILKDED